MIKKGIFYLTIGIILAFLLFTLGGRLFGIRYYVVISDSMYPKIPKNSLVYVRTIDVNETIEYDDIIAINTGGTPLMHRVIDINGDVITTHGDNNEQGVNEKINRNQVIGKVIFSIPLIGILFRSIYPVAIICLLIIGLMIGQSLIKEWRKK